VRRANAMACTVPLHQVMASMYPRYLSALGMLDI
jgi:hypothetical protein